jgi:hypothetical protein
MCRTIASKPMQTSRLGWMAALDRGLYEVLITEVLDAQLSRLGDHLQAIRGDLRAAEAADRIGLHLARVVGRAIAAILPPSSRWQRENCCVASSGACPTADRNPSRRP